MRRGAFAGVVLGGVLALCLEASPAMALGPSLWDRARYPEIGAQAALIDEAEQLQIRYHRLFSADRGERLDARDLMTLGEAYLSRATDLLEQAGVAKGGDPLVRLRLADLYELLHKNDESRLLLESIAGSNPPAVVMARVQSQLAICYAKLGRHAEEIKAYGEALALQPIAEHRALLLANRAEAYMVEGDVSAAVEGYRSALLLLTPYDMVNGNGPTTLWGLAVALDRSGDFAGAIEAVTMARTYDARDLRLNSPNWFYVPDYDRHWYEALGHWMAARKTDTASVRADAYLRAVASWKEYVSKAPLGDHWVLIAKARLAQCEKEAAEARRQAKVPLGLASKGRPSIAPGGTKAPAPPRAVAPKR